MNRQEITRKIAEIEGIELASEDILREFGETGFWYVDSYFCNTTGDNKPYGVRSITEFNPFDNTTNHELMIKYKVSIAWDFDQKIWDSVIYDSDWNVLANELNEDFNTAVLLAIIAASDKA